MDGHQQEQAGHSIWNFWSQVEFLPLYVYGKECRSGLKSMEEPLKDEPYSEYHWQKVLVAVDPEMTSHSQH